MTEADYEERTLRKYYKSIEAHGLRVKFDADYGKIPEPTDEQVRQAIRVLRYFEDKYFEVYFGKGCATIADAIERRLALASKNRGCGI